MSTEVKKWNMDIPWSADSGYILRCIEESFGPSKAGNPMITLKLEVVAPEEMEVAGDRYSIAGTKLTFWRVTRVMNGDEVDAEKTKTNEEATKELYSLFGLPNDNIDYTNPVMGFKGKCVYAMLIDDQNDKTKSPTAEQLKAGRKTGDVMIHPITKKPLTTHYPKIREIYGVAEVAGVTDRAF